MEMLRESNIVIDCEEEDEDCGCEGQGCVYIRALDDEDSDESVEEIEDEAGEH